MSIKIKLLEEDNLVTYLQKRTRRLPFSISKIKKIQRVDKNSNSNFLYQITVMGQARNFYLKQAWIYNKRSFIQGNPLAVDPSRVVGEVRLLRYLYKLWPRGVVPKVYFFDKKNFVFLMSDVSVKARLLVDEFDKNSVHPEIARLLADYLGLLHTKTYKKFLSVGSSKSYERMMVNFLFGKEWWGAALTKFFKSDKIDAFYREVKNNRVSLIWGDPIYRNIFVTSAGQVRLVDFDFTISYDPMVDVGVLLAHWLWMSQKGNLKLNRDCHKFISDFDKYYWVKWKRVLRPEILAQYKNRAQRWSGLYLLSRTDGRSGSYFEKWPAWEKRIRRLGTGLFSGEISVFNS